MHNLFGNHIPWVKLKNKRLTPSSLLEVFCHLAVPSSVAPNLLSHQLQESKRYIFSSVNICARQVWSGIDNFVTFRSWPVQNLYKRHRWVLLAWCISSCATVSMVSRVSRKATTSFGKGMFPSPSPLYGFLQMSSGQRNVCCMQYMQALKGMVEDKETNTEITASSLKKNVMRK